MKPTTKYIRDVLSGKQIVGKLARGAVERHVKDLERQGEPGFPYHFDPACAKRAITFAEGLTHTKGIWADKSKGDIHLKLEPWQQFIFSSIFGWRKADGCRRFTKAYINCAMKNGKTVKAAVIANYCFFVDEPKETAPEVYFSAVKRDQSKIAWGEAERQIQGNPHLRARAKIYRQTSTVVIPGVPGAQMKPLGKDSGFSEDGLSPSCSIIDEYHAMADNSALEVMLSGMGSRAQPLLLIISTAGFDLNSVCYTEEHAQAVQILEGSLNPVPENFFCIIYSLDKDDDWTDPNVWIKANPNLGVSLTSEYISGRIQEALLSPPKRGKIMTKNLNVWQQIESRWIQPEAWQACAFLVGAAALAGKPCYAGLDLSATQDITALVLCFPPEKEDGKYQFLYRFFLPKDGIVEKERKDRVPYRYWTEQGLIYLTDGNTVDYDYVEAQIRQDAKLYRMRELAVDPYHSQEIVAHMEKENIVTAIEISQSYSGMATGTETFERLLLSQRLAHGNNAIMNWMIGCTEVKSDRQGNICPMKPHRNRSGKRIDGVVASIMALGRAVLDEKKPVKSIYETGGLKVI